MEELRCFIGLINFYRPFIKHAAKKQAPLHALPDEARKNDKRPVLWTKEAELAFDNCKNSLAAAALLAYPDETGTIRIVVSAGATLLQLSDRGWKPLAFFSKKFNDAQRKYAAYELELTAIYMAIKHFHEDLEGRDFEMYRDHKPLQYALQTIP